MIEVGLSEQSGGADDGAGGDDGDEAGFEAGDGEEGGEGEGGEEPAGGFRVGPDGVAGKADGEVEDGPTTAAVRAAEARGMSPRRSMCGPPRRMNQKQGRKVTQVAAGGGGSSQTAAGVVYFPPPCLPALRSGHADRKILLRILLFMMRRLTAAEAFPMTNPN